MLCGTPLLVAQSRLNLQHRSPLPACAGLWEVNAMQSLGQGAVMRVIRASLRELKEGLAGVALPGANIPRHTRLLRDGPWLGFHTGSGEKPGTPPQTA